MKKTISFILSLSLLISLFGFPGVAYADAPPTVKASSGQTIAFVSPGSITSDAVYVDNSLEVGYPDQYYYQAVVKVNNATSGDALKINDSYLNGLNAYGNGTSTLVLAGQATGAIYEALLRSVTYQNTKGDFNRTVDVSFYLTYQYSYVTSSSINWQTANSAAFSTSSSIVQYMADIYSEAENILVRDGLTGLGVGNAWLGGSDSVTEGAWYWTSSPAVTNAFYVTPSGTSSGYSNWNTNPIEPNGGSGENYLSMNADGTWNDLSGSAVTSGYAIEYAYKTTKQIAFFDHFLVTCQTPVLEKNDMTVTVQAIGKHHNADNTTPSYIDYRGYFVPGASDETAFNTSGSASFSKTPMQLNTSGQAVFTLKTLKAGNYWIKVTGTSETYHRIDHFTPAVVYYIQMTASSSSITAGAFNKITLTRKDINGNAITNSGIDTLALSKNLVSPGAFADGQSDFWNRYPLGEGSGTISSISINHASSTAAFYFYSEKAGYDATLTGTVDSNRFTTSTSFTINHDVVTKFAVSTSATNVYGDEQDVEVTALDKYNNTVKNYNGTVAFTIEDTGNTEFNPLNYTFTTTDAGYHFFDNAVRFGQVGTERWLQVADADALKPNVLGKQEYIKVTPKTLTVSGLSVNSKQENGSTGAILTGTSALNGVITGDAVTLGGIASWAFPSASAGTYTATVTGLSLNATSPYPLWNYTLTMPTLTGTITPIPPSNTGGNSGGSSGGSSGGGGSSTPVSPVTPTTPVTTTSGATTSAAAGTTGQVTLRFNIGSTNSYLATGTTGEQLKLMDIAPVIYEERTLLPIRFVVEPLGGVVTYSYEEQIVTVVKGTTTIELWIGNNMAKVNGVATMIDPNNPNVKPIVIDPPGRTMMPLRFISEALGCTVEYSYELQQIIVKNWK